MLKRLSILLLLVVQSCQLAFAQIENFQKVRIDDYFGGQDSIDYADKIAVNQGALVQNAIIKNKGQLSIRGGQLLFNKDTNTSAFNGIGRFDPTSSISYLMAASGTSVVRSLSTDTNWVRASSGSVLTAGVATEFKQANSLFMVFNGTDHTSWYDGTTYTTGGTWPGSASPPTATTGAWLNNYLFLAGNTTNPDWVYVSDNGDPRSFQANQVIKIQSGDGQVIKRIEPYRTGDLMIYKERSIYDLSISALNTTCSPQPICQWSYTALVSDVGTSAPRSVVSLNNDQWFLSSPPYAIRSMQRSQFDKTFVNMISQPIQDIFDGTGSVTLNTVQVGKSAAVYFDNKYILAIPTGASTVNNYVIVYDFITSSWYVITGWYPAAWQVFNNNLYYIDANDGRVIQCFTGSTGDYGTVIPALASGPSVAINFDYKSRIYDFDNIDNFKQLDSIGLEFEPTGNYSATINVNLDNSGWQLAGTIPLTALAPTLPINLPFVLTSPGVTYKTLQLTKFGEFKKIQFEVTINATSEQIVLHKLSAFARLKPWRRE